MPINAKHYDKNFGVNHRIILRHSKLGDGLVFFCKNNSSGGWTARTFDGQPDVSHKGTTGLTASAIEQEATYSEFPPPHSVKHQTEWAAYLKLRLKAVEAEEKQARGGTSSDPEDPDDIQVAD